MADVPNISGKPLSSTEARDPHSLRFTGGEWNALVVAAQMRGVEPSAFARDCCMLGLMICESRVLMEAHLKTLSVIRADAQNLSPNGHGGKGAV